MKLCRAALWLMACMPLPSSLAIHAQRQDKPPELTCKILNSNPRRKKYFKGRGGREFFGCASDEGVSLLLSRLRKYNPLATTFVDIGANKGQAIAQYLMLWGVANRYNYTAVVDSHNPGGGRSDFVCPFSVPPEEPDLAPSFADLGHPERMKMMGFEPDPNTFAWMRSSLMTLLKAPARTEVTVPVADGILDLINAAISNTNSDMKFCTTNGVGSESSHLCLDTDPAEKRSAAKVVPVNTVDEVTTALPHIDFMKIDTEGYDPLVLEAGQRTLKSGKVDVLLFEYHPSGFWAKTTLQEKVEWLHGLGYDSYYVGQKCFLPIFKENWGPFYETRAWSNIVAIRRNLPFKHELVKTPGHHYPTPR